MKASSLIVPSGSVAARRRLERLARRGEVGEREVEAQVARIIAAVRRHGDRALIDFTARLDGVRVPGRKLRVPRAATEAALRGVPSGVRRDLELAARRIAAFHRRQRERSWRARDRSGLVLGQVLTPLERVGVYVPGGRAAYVSSLLMCAIPARVAGVREVVVATPPCGPDGPPGVVLAAAQVAGVDAVYQVGGAQAIAALAFGTETIPRVDKVVGPGNVYVATAKRLCFGAVGLDMIAGPSEVVVVADRSAPAALVAADLLAQAEHDELAAAVCLTPDVGLARRVAAEIDSQIGSLPRRKVAARALARQGAIVVTRSLSEAVELANRLAPEHLELMVRDPARTAVGVRNAGAVFLGRDAPEPLGDYLAGPSHVLPTGGTARFGSPLGVYDFTKRTSLIEGSARALGMLGAAVARLARLEGLEAHARAVERRLERGGRERGGAG